MTRIYSDRDLTRIHPVIEISPLEIPRGVPLVAPQAHHRQLATMDRITNR